MQGWLDLLSHLCAPRPTPTLAVACGWSPWTPWSLCSRSCNVGIRRHFRAGTVPPAAFGGAACQGPNMEAEFCSCGHVKVSARAEVQEPPREETRTLPVKSPHPLCTPREVQGPSLRDATKMWSPGSPERGPPWRPALLQAESQNLQRCEVP